MVIDLSVTPPLVTSREDRCLERTCNGCKSSWPPGWGVLRCVYWSVYWSVIGSCGSWMVPSKGRGTWTLSGRVLDRSLPFSLIGGNNQAGGRIYSIQPSYWSLLDEMITWRHRIGPSPYRTCDTTDQSAHTCPSFGLYSVLYLGNVHHSHSEIEKQNENRIIHKKHH